MTEVQTYFLSNTYSHTNFLTLSKRNLTYESAKLSVKCLKKSWTDLKHSKF